ncbi:DNA topoisomerase IV subunit A [Bacillus badius]|uniref:DNA topoisomerase 4 subunit A n=1 Tax=Bacillus badius TaxID=1455 RepID=A0ABR5AR70_BACBA|nr:DNA topoisomerase IV subunit A [Bacillus badius]KIL77139.1 Topoisomerase IV subunit A [Bacillus badius]MED4716723.1 DNA topoisomerase IV subunit A [Bacillus badius]
MQKEVFQDLPLEEVLGDRFGRYSKYIIQERALPDARDGLKPVQRRILYAMHTEGNTHEKGFRKSAKTVGNVIGNFHPHGDTSVYDAMVRMSQEWKLRQLLVEMHGNNGSVDGDPPAAMRYTEARLSAISGELLKDIDKRTVDFIPNFDDTTEEPTVLPARFPNLLVNGSTGISAGYATEIPPHQLGEVIDAAIMRMEHPGCTVEELMTVIKGPDFPTGGIIQGIEGIEKAYKTGKGKIIVRGKAEIEDIRGGKKQIVITEIPYDVNKANLVKKIDDFRLDRKVEGIAEVRDETDRTGLRIVIELKKDGDAQGILNYLYKASDLQISYNFNMVAIHNQRPVLMGLPELLDAYISHQKEVVTKRSEYELAKARARQHIVDGLIKALSILDEVIAAIRASKDKRDAKNNLMAAFEFTEAQAEAIVSLQLYRLTNTDITALQKEAQELLAEIEQLTAILASEKKLTGVIKKELKDVRKKYNDTRRTVIEEQIEEIKVNLEVLIPNEEVIVTVTKDGYIKRTSLRSYSASGGKDLAMKETDRLLFKEEVHTTDVLLVFTSKGSYLYLPVHELPDIRWKDLGQHVASLVALEKDESIISVFTVKDFQAPLYLLFVTKNGMVKRTELAAYKVQRYSRPLTAIKLKGDDEVIDVHLTTGSKQVFLATYFGYGLLFAEEEASLVGPRAAGVKGINLKEDDTVVSAEVWEANEERDLLLVTQRGAVKKMSSREFEPLSRASRGVVMLRELKGNPHRVAGLKLIEQEAQFVLQTEKGLSDPFDFSALKKSDRYSNGSFVLDENESGKVIAVWKKIESEES